MRAHHQALMKDPAKIESILQAGAGKARQLATPFMRELRQAVGLRNLGQQTASAAKGKSGKAALPVFKQYREADGQFRFKLLDTQGQLLLQSLGFDSPKDAAQAIALLQSQGLAALPALQGRLQTLPGVASAGLAAALQQLLATRS
jgi:tryptophanyl-tRNA synthetase